MLNCISIDDEPLSHLILNKYCQEFPSINLLQSFTNVADAIKYCDENPVDLVFLDIQIPLINGVDFCREYCKQKMVIFITAFDNYAVQGFELNAIDYLLKPIQISRFSSAIDKAIFFFNNTNNLTIEPKKKFVFVRSQYTLVKILFEDINYIETLDDYLKINLEGQKPILTKMNLKNILSFLDENHFIRVHRSYVVNVTKIDSIRGKNIKISDVDIPIGISYEKEFSSRFENFNS
jgi:DNA-binding LytR/AlgR family response regulator